jgi:hypothetical protein
MIPVIVLEIQKCDIIEQTLIWFRFVKELVCFMLQTFKRTIRI